MVLESNLQRAVRRGGGGKGGPVDRLALFHYTSIYTPLPMFQSLEKWARRDSGLYTPALDFVGAN